jgi:predicted nucleic acid-binding protein
MPYLADTNILLRLLQRNDPDHRLVRAALRTLRERGDQICFAPQNLVEFWCVCTRPRSANGFGLGILETDRRARVIERLLILLPDGPAVHAEWRPNLLCPTKLGRILVRLHGLANLLTFDVDGFGRYSGISAVHPRDV